MAGSKSTRTPSQTEAQKKRTRDNKIRRIEREIKNHPNVANNKKMMDRLEQLKREK